MIDHIRETAMNLLTVFLFSSFCGLISYLKKVEEGKTFKWFSMVLNVFISGISGLIAYVVFVHYLQMEPYVAGFLSGLAGWMGVDLVKVVEFRIKKKVAGEEKL